MLGPYRSLADEVSCDDPSPGPRRCLGCGKLAPEPARFAACIESSEARACGRGGRISRDLGARLMLWAMLLVTAGASAMAALAASYARGSLTQTQLAYHEVQMAQMVHAQAPAPATPPAPPPEPASTRTLLPSPLAQAGQEAHEPRELRRRAERLASAGLGVAWHHVALTHSDARADDVATLSFGTRVSPAHRDGRMIGLRIFGVRPGSAAEMIGLKSGDVITAANGYVLSSSDSAFVAYELSRDARAAVLEIERGERPAVITIDWQ